MTPFKINSINTCNVFHDSLQKGYLKLIYKQFFASKLCTQCINRFVIFTSAINYKCAIILSL